MAKITDLQRWICFFSEKNRMPYKHRASDSGFDIYAHEVFTINPWQKKTITTNMAIQVKRGESALLTVRASYAQRGLIQLAPHIDHGYLGPLHAVLVNLSSEPIVVNIADRYLQFTIHKIVHVNVLTEIHKDKFEKLVLKMQRGYETGLQ